MFAGVLVQLIGSVILGLAVGLPIAMWRWYRSVSVRQIQLMDSWADMPSPTGVGHSIEADVVATTMLVIAVMAVLIVTDFVFIGHALMFVAYPVLLALAWHTFAVRANHSSSH